MAKVVWIGGTSDDVSLAANWQGGSLPVNDDEAYLSDQALRDIGSGLAAAYWNDIDLSIHVESTWIRKVGAAGTPWILGGIDRLLFSGNQNAAASYFKADNGAAGSGSDVMALCVCDTPALREDVLNIEGVINRIACLNGSMTVLGGATVNSRITVSGGTLNIPASVTLTGAETSCLGGQIRCQSDAPTVLVGGGQFTLVGADIGTYLEVNDGTFRWEEEGISGAHSIIALAECYGGLFQTIKPRQYRTVTEMNMYNTASVDLSAGGLMMTLPTGGIGVFGDNAPKMPKGTRLVPAI